MNVVGNLFYPLLQRQCVSLDSIELAVPVFVSEEGCPVVGPNYVWRNIDYYGSMKHNSKNLAVLSLIKKKVGFLKFTTRSEKSRTLQYCLFSRQKKEIGLCSAYLFTNQTTFPRIKEKTWLTTRWVFSLRHRTSLLLVICTHQLYRK